LVQIEENERKVVLSLHIAFLAEELAAASREAVSVVNGFGSENNVSATLTMTLESSSTTITLAELSAYIEIEFNREEKEV
jgi:hypothetical protein